ncbi:MAG TPA: SgcJ/EcaC family oxidoreductase [Gemmatimonadales bacterium]|nr:SgcJ/EcaC family oxidoreductase [Gemmatimonadales bacterium]
MTATPHIALALLVLPTLLGCGAAAPAPDPAAREAIEAAVSRYVAASNQGDAEALTELYTDDAVLLPPDHAPVRGRAAIAEFWRQGTDSGLAVTTLRVEVDGSIGYLVGQYNLPETPSEPADSGKYVMCLRRQRDGTWKLSADIWNSSAEDETDEEEPAPAPSVT